MGQVHVSPGTFIAALGSDSPDKQELEPQLLAHASAVPDLLSQASHVGELHHAIAAGLFPAHQIRGELGAVIAGTAPARTQKDEIIIFDSTATALQDCAAAAAVYEGAVDLQRGEVFGFWK